MLSPSARFVCVAEVSLAADEMAGLRRMIVGLKRHEKSEVIVPAKFIDCIVNYFLPNELRVRVSCELKDDMLVLSPAQDDGDIKFRSSEDIPLTNTRMSSVLLQHSPECPILRLDEPSQVSEKVRSQGVYVAVTVILESLDHKILLTQRSDRMRAFPRVWVPPGGHLECGETLLECAFRELKEETGLKFEFGESQAQLLCLWESVFPVLLGFGVPKNHHIVVYYYLRAQETSEELQKKIKLDPEEVQACTWLCEQNVENLFERSCDDLGKVVKFHVEPDGSQYCSELDLSTMFHPSLWQDKKIYSGTQLALYCWLRICQNKSGALLSKI
ncbi:Nucleoside diphosphate-linked moiety X motif 17 [Gryllus bimaculatus]|nr:Nucleoside diphosphate-linked moiety X motif 17 [Gryllus bimaculatus]